MPKIQEYDQNAKRKLAVHDKKIAKSILKMISALTASTFFVIMALMSQRIMTVKTKSYQLQQVAKLKKKTKIAELAKKKENKNEDKRRTEKKKKRKSKPKTEQ